MDSDITRKKGVGGIAPWSPWEWDNNGFWKTSRINDSGNIEYTHHYPIPERDYQVREPEAHCQYPVPEARSEIDHTPAQAVPRYVKDRVIDGTHNFYSNDDRYTKEGPQITSTSGISTHKMLGNWTPYSPSSSTTTSPHATEYSLRRASTTNGAPQRNNSSASSQMIYGQNPASFAGNVSTDYTGYRMPKLSTKAPGNPWSLDGTLQSEKMRDIGNALSSMNISISSTETVESGSDSISEGLYTLDSRYRVIDQPSRFFTIGRIFMMLWTEPARQEFPSGGLSHYSATYLGGKAFSEIRRFVVVANGGRGNTICCPIHTYGGQGTLKPNLPDKEMHAAVYSYTEEPQLPAEEELIIEPFSNHSRRH
ncbi:hypothetical protein EYC80_001394 [Monilinia laxa]|uniref:DUF6590 domain-containing protein n=1 Tax=Monilinia laxa TaxID=61186 RepID=A0A5N6KA40_MONLA|nr:hypothetical protein EYC80_001394 [Monilinia laxa]